MMGQRKRTKHYRLKMPRLDGSQASKDRYNRAYYDKIYRKVRGAKKRSK